MDVDRRPLLFNVESAVNQDNDAVRHYRGEAADALSDRDSARVQNFTAWRRLSSAATTSKCDPLFDGTTRRTFFSLSELVLRRNNR
jgi:hypothetical protein